MPPMSRPMAEKDSEATSRSEGPLNVLNALEVSLAPELAAPVFAAPLEPLFEAPEEAPVVVGAEVDCEEGRKVVSFEFFFVPTFPSSSSYHLLHVDERKRRNSAPGSPARSPGRDPNSSKSCKKMKRGCVASKAKWK